MEPPQELRPASPLDAEGERLRQQSYADHEISQILIARETGAAQAPPGAQAPPTGVLANLTAVLSHARNFLPGIKGDLITMFDRASPFGARLGAAIYLVFKVAVVA